MLGKGEKEAERSNEEEQDVWSLEPGGRDTD